MRGSRRWAVAAAVAVPLLAGGCGSGDDTPDGAESPSASESTGKDSSGGPGGGKDSDGPDDGGTEGASSSGGSGGGSSSGGSGGSSGGGAGKDGDVSPYQGTWSTEKAGSGDELLIMNIERKSVSLLGDGVACQGSLKAAEKPASIKLTCKNDSKKYAAGSVAEVDGKQLSVEWGSERTTRFTKGMKMTEPPG